MNTTVKHHWVIAVLTCALIACQGNPPPPVVTKPFTPEIDVTSSNIVSEGSMLLRSSYAIYPQPTSYFKPTWALTSGSGALEPREQTLRVFRALPTAQITSSTVETTHLVDGQVYSKSVNIKVHPVSTVLPSAGSGLAAMTLTRQPAPRVDYAYIAGENIYSYVSTFDSGAINSRLEIHKFSRAGVMDSNFAQAGTLRVPLTDTQRSNAQYQVLGSKLGNLLVLTNLAGSTTLRKFDPAGSPIGSFGSNGVSTIGNTIPDYGRIRFVLDDSENLYLYDPSSRAVARVTSSTGALDTGFGGTGSVPLPKNFELIGMVPLGNDLWLSGSFFEKNELGQSISLFGLIKIKSTGAFDGSFGKEGVFEWPKPVTEVPRQDTWTHVSVQSDGSILAFGTTGFAIRSVNPSNNREEYLTDLALSVTRLLPNGQVDTAFGTNGSTSVGVLGVKTAILLTGVKGFVGNGKIRLVQQPQVLPNEPATPLVVVTVSASGALEKITRATYNPAIVDLGGASYRDETKVWNVEALPDGSLFTVGPICSVVTGALCQQNIGFSHFNP
jgi:hypothetical protein